MTLFRAGIRSEVSRYYYERRLGSFLAWLNSVSPENVPGRTKERAEWTQKLATDFVKKARKDPKWAEGRILAYILHLLERVKWGELSPHTVDTYKKPVKLFLDMNDVTGLNWKRINKLVPAGDAVAEDRAYTPEEVRALAGDTDLRFRAAILLYASSGIRGGALKGLKIGHMKPVERGEKVVAARVRVYAGSREEYETYATSEFWTEYQRYLDLRRKSGESVELGSPAFALEKTRSGTRGPAAMDGSALRSLLDVRLRRLGFREGTVGRSGKGGKRHEVAILHGLRKFFETQCLRAGLSPYTVDVLLGHATGLHQHYDRRSGDEFLDKYLEAAPYLAVLSPQLASENEHVKELEERIKGLERDRNELIQATQENINDVLNRRFGPRIAKLEETIDEMNRSLRSNANTIRAMMPTIRAIMPLLEREVGGIKAAISRAEDRKKGTAEENPPLREED